MIDVTVKTLDGKNRSFSVPEDITVKHFKEKIAGSIEIPADRQRLIFQGRVLLDEKKLNHYDVHGKVIHVVQRAPPSSRPPPSPPAAEGVNTSSSSVVISSFSLPGEAMDPAHVQNIVQQTLSGMGDIGRNARVSSRTTDDGTGLDVHINLGDIHIGPPQPMSESNNRIQLAQRMVREAEKVLDRLENPDQAEEEASTMDTSNGHTDRQTDHTQPQEGSEPQAEGATATPSTSAAGSQSTAGAPGTTTGSPNQAGTENRPNQPREPQHPPPPVLGELLGQVFRLNERLQPHLERYQTLLNEDPTIEGETAQRDAQRLCDRVPEAMHYLSHAYHNISDVMLHLERAPPRQLRAQPVALQVQHVVRHAIPVVAEVNIPAGAHGPFHSPTPPPATTTAAAASTAQSTQPTSTSTTTTPSAPGGAPPPGGPPPLGAMPPRFPGMPPAFAMGPHGAVMVMEVGPNGVMNPIPPPGMGPPGPRSGPTSTAPSAPQGPPITGVQITRIPLQGFQVNAGGVQPMPSGAGMNVIQGIMQAVEQAVSQGAAQHGTSSSTAGTSLSTSTTTTSSASSRAQPVGPPTSSGQTQGGGHGPRLPPPGAMPLGPGGFMMPPFGGPRGFPGGGLPIDPTLPCQSRHWASQRAARAAQHSSQSPDQVVASAVTSIVRGLSGQAMPPGGGRPSASGVSTSTTQSTAGSVPTPNPGSTPRAGHPVQIPDNLPFMDTLRGVLLQGQQQSGAPGTQAPPPTNVPAGQTDGASSAAPTQMSDEVFTQLLRGISGYMTQAAMGQQPQETVGDFLDNLGQNFQINRGEGFLTDVFNCLARHLNFVDLMSVFYGNGQPLNRTRQGLQEFIKERMLQGREPTEINVTEGVDRVLQEMQDEIRLACTDVEVRDDIDLPATITNFLRHHFQELVRYIMAAQDDATFGQTLFNKCRLVMHKFIVLCQYCLRGGLDDFERLVQNYVRRVSSDVNPMIQQWMANMTAVQLRSMAPSISTPQEQIQQFVVRHGQMEVNGSSDSHQAPQVATSSASVTQQRAQVVPNCGGSSEPMDIDIDGDHDPEPDDPRERANHVIEQARATGPEPPRPDPRDAASIELGSEDWHRVVPREWVSVISRDVNRQAREPPRQAPYSDAYLDCVPSKKRKVMTEEKPKYESGDMPSVLPEAIRQAAAAAGVQPVTSQEALAADARENQDVQRAFGNEVQHTIRHRLNNDPDYSPEKYPSSEKYFKK